MDKRLQYSQSGRSLTEMLGVLTVIGILTIGAVAGYRYAVDKTQANTISRDARMVYTAFHGRVNVEINPAEPWEQVSDYTPVSGKQFWAQRTQTGDFVLVEEVAKGVCNRLLDMQGAHVSFFDEEGFRFAECTDANNMVFSFNGESLKPSCDTAEKCGAGFNGYCHDEGICIECEDGFEGDAQNKKCNQICAENEKSCTYGDGNGWCCPDNLICNYDHTDEDDMCIESDGLCAFNLGEGAYTTLTKYANCSMILPETPDELDTQITKYANCKMTLPETPDELDTQITKYANCSMTLPETPDGADKIAIKLTDNGDCPGGEYCVPFWVNGEVPSSGNLTGLSHDSAGTLYGMCQKDFSTFNNIPAYRYPTSNQIKLTDNGDCPGGEYCVPFWVNGEVPSTDNLTGLSNDSAGTLYGMCQKDFSTFNNIPAYRYPTSNQIKLTDNGDCPSGEYCVPFWKNGEVPIANNLTGLSNDSAGTLYGMCQKDFSVFNSIPAIQYGNNYPKFVPTKECPKGQWCYPGWSTKQCTAIADDWVGDIYGKCISYAQSSASCPYK